jgi:predicted dehydrogenase
MKSNKGSIIPRRRFIQKSASLATGLTVGLSARSYARICGSNDRINIAFLGCGARSYGHMRMVRGSYTDKNLRAVAVCDIWKNNREKAASVCKNHFNTEIAQYKYSEDLLNDQNVDAVMIATGDHQHAKILDEVVKAGKDCYCEKPMAQDIGEAKLARETVLNSDQVVQMGSQWVSESIHRKIREIVRSGRLGQITKIEQCWNDNNHRWHDPDDPDVAAIREEDTDWNNLI